MGSSKNHRHLAFGTFSTNLKPNQRYGITLAAKLSGMMMDIDQLRRTAVNTDNDLNKAIAFNAAQGPRQSANEHLIPEALFDDPATTEKEAEAVSAVKALSKVHPDSVVYTDHWRSYNALDVAGFVHHPINHSTQFAQGRNHINGIENFWNQAKRVMRKYNGIPTGSFELFLKECEFRFNYGSPKQQLKVLRAWTQI